MNNKKKRVAPLKSLEPSAGKSDSLPFEAKDTSGELVDDVLDELFGDATADGESANGFIDLDDWSAPVFKYESDDENCQELLDDDERATPVAIKSPIITPLSSKSTTTPKNSLKELDSRKPSSLTVNESSPGCSKTFEEALSEASESATRKTDLKINSNNSNNDFKSKSAVKLMFTSREYDEDPVLNLRFSKRDIPAAFIKDMAKNMEFLSLTASLKLNEGKSFFTAGVVTSNVPLRKTGSMIVLTDLASEPCSVRVMLFGTAFDTYNKLAAGTIVILMKPRKGKPYNGRESLVVNDSNLMSVAGCSKDYGVCGVRTKAGGACKNVVNLKLCRYCSIHAVAQFKEQKVAQNLHSVATGRGLLDDKKSQSKTDLWMAPANKSKTLRAAKVNFGQVNKDRDTLSRLDNANSCSKYFEESSVVKKHDVSLIALKRKFNEMEYLPKTEQLLPSEHSKIEKISGCFENIKTTPLFKQRMSAAKTRALAFARQSGGITPEANRKSKQQVDTPEVKKTKNDVLTPEYLALMKEKASDPKLLAAAEAQERDKRFDRLSVIEEIGEKLVNTTEVPVRAIRCLVCEKNYFQMPLQCVKSKHKCRVVTATKRYFQCSGCKKRTTTLERLPTTECDKCKRWAWKKCGVAGDRLCTSSEKLSIRGLEEKFLGSVVTDANLSLLVPDDK